MNENDPAIIVAGQVEPAYQALLNAAGYTSIRQTTDLGMVRGLHRQQPADIMLLGGVDPRNDDLTFLDTLRESDRTHGRYTSVIWCLKSSDTEGLRAAFGLGMDDYLLETADTAQLRARIGAALRLASIETRLLHHPGAAAMGAPPGKNAMLDILTGVGTLHYLNDQLSSLLQETRSRGGISCCVSICIDRWEELRQRYGMKAGDELLRDIARRLRKALRPIDCVSRVAEGEFAVALRYTDSNDARPWIFERMLRTISYPAVKTSLGEVHVTASLGASCADGQSSLNAQQMLAAASQNAADARKMGGNKLVL